MTQNYEEAVDEIIREWKNLDSEGKRDAFLMSLAESDLAILEALLNRLVRLEEENDGISWP